MKKKKYAFVVMMFAMCMLVACGKNSKYDAEYEYVLTYLHDNYGGNYTIGRCDFQHYDYGFTAGQYMYTFEISDSNGTKYRAHYMRSSVLCEGTVSEITFEPIE